MSRDEPHLGELAKAVSAGFLAEEVVFAAGRLARGEALDEAELRTVGQARWLLEAAISPPTTSADPSGLQQLAAGDSALDALYAARTVAPDEDIEAHLKHLVDVLSAASEGNDVSDETDALTALRTLFASLGHFTLARANKLSRTREDRLLWTGSPTTSTS